MAKIERSEEAIISRDPVQVTLGTEKYDIHPLSILANRQWRKKAAEEINSISTELGKDATETRAFVKGLQFAFIAFPEKVAELVFAYAPNLPMDKVLDEATEEQLAAALGVVIQLAFPFSRQLQMLNQAMTIGNLSR